MANLLQGAPLPNITTTQQQSTVAPQFYNDYLSNLAQQGGNALNNGQFAGVSPLQQQAFDKVGQNVGNYNPYLTQSKDLATQAGGASPLGAFNPYAQAAVQSGGGLAAAQPYFNSAMQDPSAQAQQYMNPYTSNVVNEIGRLGQQNIQENLAPQATAAAVGSGQFGSQRGAQVLGNTLRDANANILGQQGNALNAGYQQALQAAQQQNQLAGNIGAQAGSLGQQQAGLLGQLGQAAGSLTGTGSQLQLGASQQLGALGQQAQQGGLADVNALATLGGQQQQIQQAQNNFGLTNAQNVANLLKGYQVPTTVNSTNNAPIPGAYSASPLQQIAGAGSLVQGLGGISAIGSNIGSLFSGLTGGLSSLGSLFGNSAGDPWGTGGAGDPFDDGGIG